MTAFGVSPLGEDLGPFGGPGLITVLGVLPEGLNSCIVVFDRYPRSLDDQSPFSGVNPSNYTLAAVDPTIVAGNGDIIIPAGGVVPTYTPNIVGAAVDATDPTQIVLSVDAAFEPGVEYQVTLTNTIKSTDCDDFAGTSVFSFTGRRLPNTPTRIELYEERFRDLDYAIIPDPAHPGGTTQAYRFDDSGDVAIAGNTASLKKRLFRRITTQPGQFAFLPGYGVGLTLKALARANRMQELSNLISEQVKLEPDVLNAGAATSLRRTGDGAVVVVSLQVVQDDARERKFLFEFPM